MATYRYFNLVQSGLFGVSYIETTPTRITVTTNGLVETYTGAFSYSGNTVVGGTVTGYSLSQDGRQIATGEGMTVSAPALANAVLSADTAGVGNLMFAANDEIWGSTNGEALAGFGGNDTIIALDGNDSVAGGAGDDDVNGNVGRDVVGGEAGADWVRGGRDNDTLFGGAGDDPHVNGNLGDDSVNGDAGNDTVFGGQGQDWVQGGAGDDLVSGDLGDDTLEGGTGSDQFYGGAGLDIFMLRTGDGFDFIMDFNDAQGDRVLLPRGTVYSMTTYQGYAAVDIDNATDAIVFYGLTLAQLGDWAIFA